MSAPRATACYCGTCQTCRVTAPRSAVADPVFFGQGAIKRRLLSRIGSIEIEGRRPLDGLGTREDDDPGIALIDAFAGSLHILAWNAARLFDDGSIRCTEDRDALVDLTRLLGYEPRPTLAATTTLAFTVDTFEGSPQVAMVSKGTKVASVPGQDEKPQTFETDADLEARGEWNALEPVRQKTVPQVSAATTSITITGASTAAKTGDLVVVYLEPQTSPIKWLLARVALVVRQPDLDPPRTRIDLASAVALPAITSMQGDQFKNLVVILGQGAAPFGATAPDLSLMSDAVRITQIPSGDPVGPPYPTEWLDLTIQGGTAQGGNIDLDAVYPDAMMGRFVVFSDDQANLTQLGQIDGSSEFGRKGFGLSAKVTRVNVKGIDLSAAGFRDKVRTAAIHIETSREALLVVDADAPIPLAATDRLIVQGTVSLPVGRRIVLWGEPCPSSPPPWTTIPGKGPKIGEVALLRSSAPAGGGTTELVFERAIASCFRATTLRLLANCVRASHGETPVGPPELIGSGNPATPSPRFQLKRSPLTHVPSASPRGYAPAIEVRVGERLYEEQPTLFGLGSEDRAYTVQTGRDGYSTVQFSGRLLSGTHNVTALYRTGGGKAGNLAPGRVTTVLTPIIGVGKVTNPVAADGADDAEAVEEIRVAGPRSIRTLDRVVSLADYEAFARTYRGVGKAIATELHVGMRSAVCLTIATTSLLSPDAGSDVVEGLRKALAQATAPGRAVRIEGFTDLTADVTVALVIDTAFRRPDVEAAVRAELGHEFGRGARNFSEPLHRSAVLAAVQSVEGVRAARLQVFQLPGGPAESEGRLLCPAPSMAGGVFTKAGLLSIDADQVQFVEMLP